MHRSAVCLADIAVLLGGAASGADAPSLAISATGVLGDDDTIVIAVSNPSTRVAIDVPAGYAFPRVPLGGHAFIEYADGSGERGVVDVHARNAEPCAAGEHEQVWELGFSSAHVFVFLADRRMTICPLPSRTTKIVLASKYWTTPHTRGDYAWRATTSGGADATATIRLPVLLTLAQTKRGHAARIRVRLTENGVPVAAKFIQLVVGHRSVATARTRLDGSALFTLHIRRKIVVHAATSLGEQAGEPHTLQSKPLAVRP